MKFEISAKNELTSAHALSWGIQDGGAWWVWVISLGVEKQDS